MQNANNRTVIWFIVKTGFTAHSASQRGSIVSGDPQMIAYDGSGPDPMFCVNIGANLRFLRVLYGNTFTLLRRVIGLG